MLQLWYRAVACAKLVCVRLELALLLFDNISELCYLRGELIEYSLHVIDGRNCRGQGL